MARVPLTQYIISDILYQVEQAITKNHGKLPEYPAQTSNAVADEAYSILMPAQNEKEICDLYPDWALPKHEGMYINVMLPGTQPDRYSSRRVLAMYGTPHITLNGRTTIRNVPGIAEAYFDGTKLIISPATDGSVIPHPNLKAFVEEMTKINQEHDVLAQEIKKARGDMDTFLKQHTTLQSAVKVGGSALLAYVPKHIMATYDKAPVKRQVKPKPEKVDVDIDYLIANAMTATLDLVN